MSKSSPTQQLSIPHGIAGRYAVAANKLKAKFSTVAPSTAELISHELMSRTPSGIVEDFEQGNWSRRRASRGSVVVKKRG